MPPENIPQFESNSVCAKYFGGFVLNKVYRLLVRLVLTVFLKYRP